MNKVTERNSRSDQQDITSHGRPKTKGCDHANLVVDSASCSADRVFDCVGHRCGPASGQRRHSRPSHKALSRKALGSLPPHPPACKSAGGFLLVPQQDMIPLTKKIHPMTPDFDDYERHLIKEINEGRIDKSMGITMWMKYNVLSKQQRDDCFRVVQLAPTTKILEEQAGRECTCQNTFEHDPSCPLHDISKEHITAAIDAVLGE